MGIGCGSQVAICDVPIRLDTYRGCSHGCKYCFVKRDYDISKVDSDNCVESLNRFISGRRTRDTNWCDWSIPLHWGGLSDPFQPIERKAGVSLRALRLFAETGYPFIVSTKGRLIADEPYLSLLSECNAVVQVSMVSPRFDRLEPGAPSFDERMAMLPRLAKACKRLVVRCQPYMTDCLADVLASIPRYAKAGAYGVIVEGFKSFKAFKGSVKVGNDYAYGKETLESHFTKIREACHSFGLAFLCGENRLRAMGDSLTCCGCSGLDGFEPNAFNLAHLANGDERKPTEAMLRAGTANAFSGMFQEAGIRRWLGAISFDDAMRSERTLNACAVSLGAKDGSVAHTEDEVLAFTRWLKSTGIKAKEVNWLTGTQMASHYLCTTRGGQCSVPTPEQFEKIRKSASIPRVLPNYIKRIVYGK